METMSRVQRAVAAVAAADPAWWQRHRQRLAERQESLNDRIRAPRLRRQSTLVELVDDRNKAAEIVANAFPAASVVRTHGRRRVYNRLFAGCKS